MKKSLLLALAITTAGTALSDPIDLERARNIASRLTEDGSMPSLVKKASRAEAKSRLLPYSCKDTAPYYIFSRGTGKGFVIVSGDDCLPEILGYTETGDYIEEQMPEQLIAWLDMYGSLIEDAQIRGAKSRKSRIEAFGTDGSEKMDVPYLIKTNWTQGWPYNNKCPQNAEGKRGLTGCVATAGSQVVHYFAKDNPDTLMAATPTYNYGIPVTESFPAGTPILWDLMTPTCGSSTPEVAIDAVATLMACTGAATWLTYGTGGTSGQTSNLPNTFSKYYNLSAKYMNKSSVSQSQWEDLLYNELVEGRPMVYRGNQPSGGGHAVVVDGYQASTNLFHFNFGWGGQGNGYYTVDDETGMNGYSSQQGAVYDIRPKKQNLRGSISVDKRFYAYRTNTIDLRIENRGTLDYRGIYLFAKNTFVKPSGTYGAQGKDIVTVIPADGESYEMSLDVKMSKPGKTYLFLTDKNCNIIAVDSVTAEEPDTHLEFVDLSVSGSLDKEQIGGEDYTVVYNNKATGLLTLRNNGTVSFDGMPRIKVYSSKDEGNTFSYVGYKSASAEIEAGETVTLEFNISNNSSCPIEPGIPHYVVLEPEIRSINETVEIEVASEDTVAGFIIRDSDLEASGYENRILKLKGKWDPAKFTSLAEKRDYADAVGYDLTEVEGIDSIFGISKDNVLYYVSDDSKAKGVNVVRVNENGMASCCALQLASGSDFIPAFDFTAETASFKMEVQPGKWQMVMLPFDVEVPNGMIARKVLSHSTLTGILNKTQDIDSIKSGTPTLVMATDRMFELCADDVLVNTDAENSGDTAFIGTYVNMPVPDKAFVVNMDETQYFEPAETGTIIPAMGGYFFDEKTTRRFKAASSASLDPAYQVLGETISKCTDIQEEYEDILTDEALAEVCDSISTAKTVFSERSIGKGTDVEKYADSLYAFVMQSRFCLMPETQVYIDCTDMIVNPSFETRNTSGWEAESEATVKACSNFPYKAVGADGGYALYNINYEDSTGTEISQTLRNMPEGNYRLTAMLGTDGERTVALYAGGRESVVQAHKYGEYYLREAVVDSIEVGPDGILQIGVRPMGRWYKADDFRLVYMGNKTGTTTGLDRTESDIVNEESVKAYGGKNSIRVVCFENSNIRIYSLSGQMIYSADVDGEYTFTGLNKGIYIVNGCKVVVY